MKKENVESLAIWSGFLSFLISINPFFVWISSFSYFLFLGFLLVLFSTILLGKIGLLSFTNKRLAIVGVVLVLVPFLSLKGLYIGAFLKFVPFALMVLWQDQLLYGIYEKFKKTMYICAVWSLIITVLSAADLLKHLPYIEFPAQSSIQEMAQTTNRVYGFVSTNYSLRAPIDIVRACGPLQEPGHFAVFLGIIYFFEKVFNRKVNIWVILGGIATFSSNFLLMFLLAHFYVAFVEKRILQMLKWVSLGITTLIILFFCLPSYIQEQVLFVAYERNMASVVDAALEGGVGAALSERTNNSGEAAYETFLGNSSAIWIGMPEMVDDGTTVLSDYRGVVYSYGLIGFMLILLLIFFSIQSKWMGLSIGLFCIESLILLHRSWMMSSSYIYFMVIIGIAAYSYLHKNWKYETK